jgi:hypothetical protein
MKATRNTVRFHRPVDVSSVWEDVKEWAGRNLTNEKVARNTLALAGAVSIGYVAAQVVQAAQGLVVHAY